MTDKTTADVIDNIVNHLSNGFDKMAGGIDGVAKAAQKIAPDVWRVLVHQQRMLGIKDMIIGIVCCIPIIIILFLLKKYFKIWIELAQERNEEGYYVLIGMLLVIMCISIIPSIINFTDGFVIYNSAEYYAAKDLILMIKDR